MVTIVPTGSANLASVRTAFQRLGANCDLATDAASIAQAERLVLPGVGSFAAAMSRLEADGLVEAIVTRIADGRPVLAVCVGLQILCAASGESPGARGLGVVRKSVMSFTGDVRSPQMGWNRVTPDPGCRRLREGYAYFANSYRLGDAPVGASVAWSEHGGPFVAAFERGSLLACQFHPELSGAWGLELLRRWLERKGGA